MDWFAYVALIPLFAVGFVDTFERWKGRPRLVRWLTVVAFILALGAVAVSNGQHDKETAGLESRLSTLLTQNEELQKSVSTLQSQNEDLQTRNRDLQNDMDGIRAKLKVPATRPRDAKENLKTSDSVTAIPVQH